MIVGYVLSDSSKAVNLRGLANISSGRQRLRPLVVKPQESVAVSRGGRRQAQVLVSGAEGGEGGRVGRGTGKELRGGG